MCRHERELIFNTSSYKYYTTSDVQACSHIQGNKLQGARRRREMYRRGCSSYQRLPIRLHRKLNRIHYLVFTGYLYHLKVFRWQFLTLTINSKYFFSMGHQKLWLINSMKIHVKEPKKTVNDIFRAKSCISACIVHSYSINWY